MNTSKFNNKVDVEMNKFKKIKSAFEKISKAESNTFDVRHKYFNTLSLLKEKDNPELSDIYNEVLSTMLELENKRKEIFKLIDSKVIPSTVNYINQAKELKKGVSNYQNLIKNNEKKEKERQKVASNNEIEKDKLIQNEIQSGKTEILNKQLSNEEALLSYENNRIMNNKYLILHYIHSELAYHASAVEKLSKTYTTIFNKFPIANLPNFVKDYNLNINDNQLGDYGYDKKKFKRNKQPKQQEQLNNRNFGMIQNNSNINDDNSNIEGSNINRKKRNFGDDSLEIENNRGRRNPNDEEFGDGNMAY